MAIEPIWYVRGIEIAGLLLGLTIAYFAYRGYQKSGSRSLIYTATGFVLLSLASMVEGIAFEFAGIPLLESTAIRSTITLLGFLVLLYSIRSLK